MQNQKANSLADWCRLAEVQGSGLQALTSRTGFYSSGLPCHHGSSRTEKWTFSEVQAVANCKLRL